MRELLEVTAQVGPVDIKAFLDETGRSLGDLYQAGGWTSLRRLSGLELSPHGPDEERLQRAIGRLRHIRDAERIECYTAWLKADHVPELTDLTERERRLLTMLHFDLWGPTRVAEGLEFWFARFWSHDAWRAELEQLLEVIAQDVAFESFPLAGFPDVPLQIHGRYTRDEILAALGISGPDAPREWREGVRWVERQRLDLLAVTIEKVASRFSPTTMYRDRPISPVLFQWESQSTTSIDSPTGCCYVGHEHSGDRTARPSRDRPVRAPRNYSVHVPRSSRPREPHRFQAGRNSVAT